MILLEQKKRKREKAGRTAEKLPELQELVHQRMEQFIFENVKHRGMSEEEVRKLALQRSRLRQAIRECALGSSGDRILVKEYIKDILTEQLHAGEVEFEELIPFEHQSCLSIQDKFEILQEHFQQKYQTEWFKRLYQKIIELSKELKKGEKTELTEAELQTLYQTIQPEPGFLEKLEIISQRIYQNLYGYSVCDGLISDETALEGVAGGCGGKKERSNRRTEAEIYGYDTIFVMLEGKKIRLSFLSFGTEQMLAAVVKRISRNNSRMQLSRRYSYLVTNLKNNSRVVAARPPVSDGWGFYVRKFQTVSPKRMEELLTDEGQENAISLLRLLVRGELNLIITGEQASGKTTLLKSLVGFIRPEYSIRVAESVFESRLNELYPERNIHSMQEYAGTGLKDVIAFFKKTDTDVTICGEINEPEAAGAMIQIAQSGGRFTISTSHHGTTEKLIHYMRNALLACAGFQKEAVALEQVLEALQIDVHLAVDRAGHRYLERITEIIPKPEGGYEKQDILKYSEGRYLLCGEMNESHVKRIMRNYPECMEEAAAIVFGKG